jgi:hypothetical protein
MPFARIVLWALLIACLAGCVATTVGVVAPVDTASGYLLTDQKQAPAKATTTVSRSVDLKSVDFVLVYGGTYYRDQLRQFNAFSKVIAEDELGRYIVAAGLQEEIQSVKSDVDFNRLYRRLKPFLVLKMFTDVRNDGAYLTMAVVDPKDLAEVFRAEVLMSPNVRQRTDQEVRFPLFNSLRDWLRTNGGLTL